MIEIVNLLIWSENTLNLKGRRLGVERRRLGVESIREK
jgi:hypothetical protein